MAVDSLSKWTPPRKSGGIPQVSTRFSLSIEMSRLTQDRTAEPVSRVQILRRERGQGNVNFPCSTDHGCKVLTYIITIVLYCTILYCPLKSIYHNPMKQNHFFYAKSYPYKTHVHVLRPSPCLSLTHVVSKVRYSVKYKHHKRYR